MQPVEPSVGFPFLRSRQSLGRGDSRRIVPVQTASASIFDANRIQGSLVPAGDPSEALAVFAIAEQFAIARGRQNVNATVDPHDPTSQGQRLRFTRALEDRPPTAVPLRHERPAEGWNCATFAQRDCADARDPDALLSRVQFERAVAVRKFQLLPTHGGLKSGVTSLFTALDAPKERRKREIEPVQHRVLTFTKHARESGVFRTQRRDLGVLHLPRDVDAARFPGVATLVEQRVVRLPGYVQHEPQPLFLSSLRIQANAVHPAHPREVIASKCQMYGTIQGEDGAHFLNRAPRAAYALRLRLRTAAPRRLPDGSPDGVAHVLLASAAEPGSRSRVLRRSVPKPAR